MPRRPETSWIVYSISDMDGPLTLCSGRPLIERGPYARRILSERRLRGDLTIFFRSRRLVDLLGLIEPVLARNQALHQLEVPQIDAQRGFDPDLNDVQELFKSDRVYAPPCRRKRRQAVAHARAFLDERGNRGFALA